MEDDDGYIKTLNHLDIKIKDLEEQQVKVSNKIKILKAERTELQNQYNLSKVRSTKNNTREWIENRFNWSKQLELLLKEKFKFQKFRSKQLAAINATLSERDVLLVMPTGGGKSLVYQLPALVCKHITLVVSPLISLIDDQLGALRNIGITAATLNSSLSKEEKNKIHLAMTNQSSNLKLLYVTPEWVIKSKIFMSNLQKCFQKGCLDRIVIDEVHCCTTWGHDFRPEYNQLGFFKAMFPDVPILGLTATATMHTLVDIQKTLGVTDALIMTAPFNRPNLHYMVVDKPTDKNECIDALHELLRGKFKGRSGIIYTVTIKECEEVTNSLRARGIKARAYFASMEDKIKKKVQECWMQNQFQVIVATIAFGMGIDKPDVYFVIHHCIPKTMEGYYQESGRAGRNGEKCHCILMFSLADHLRNVVMCGSVWEIKNTKPILGYCLNRSRCRRAMIAEHFEDTWRQTDCAQMCDNCKSPQKLTKYNITSALYDIVNLIETASLKEVKLTLNKLMNAWYQTGAKELRIPNLKSPRCSKNQAEHIIAYLIFKMFLTIDKGYTMYTTVAYIAKGCSIGKTETVVMPYATDLKYPKWTSNVVHAVSDDENQELPVKKKKSN